MSSAKEPILRIYPEYPRKRIGEVSYSQADSELFAYTMMGMYYSPSLEKLHGVVQKLANNPNTNKESQTPLADFMIYNLVISFANIMGLAMPNTPKVRPEDKIFTKDKFELVVRQAEKWAATDERSRHAATIGAYDAPHPFHLLNIRREWARSTRIMVGIDPNWVLKERKSKPGDERPRFPYLLYRMWQLACSPMVDVVFELPIEPGQVVKDRLPSIWNSLGVSLLATESNHEYLSQYKEQMKAQGGSVLTSKPYPWWGRLLEIRSTSNLSRLEHIYFDKKWGPDKWQEIMRKRENQIMAKIAKRDLKYGF